MSEPKHFEDLKVGDTVTHYSVGRYNDPHNFDRIVLQVKRKKFTVEGDEDGQPLCLVHTADEWFNDDRKHLHEIALTELEAVRRYRAGLLMDVVKSRVSVERTMGELKKVVKLTTGEKVKPDGVERVRVATKPKS